MEDVNNVLFSGAVGGDLSADLDSDWLILNDNVTQISIEAIWNGAPNGTLSLEQKIQGSRTVAATATVSASPDGTSYTGNLDASDLDAESLGESLITATLLTNRVRLHYVRTGGTGEIRAKIVAKKQ